MNQEDIFESRIKYRYVDTSVLEHILHCSIQVGVKWGKEVLDINQKVFDS